MSSYYLLLFTLVMVTFAETSYRVDEDDNAVQITLQLSQPSPQDFTVTVSSSDITATRKHVSTSLSLNSLHVFMCL